MVRFSESEACRDMRLLGRDPQRRGKNKTFKWGPHPTPPHPTLDVLRIVTTFIMRTSHRSRKRNYFILQQMALHAKKKKNARTSGLDQLPVWTMRWNVLWHTHRATVLESVHRDLQGKVV